MTPEDKNRLAEIRARLASADEMATRFLGGPMDDDMGFLLRLVDEATGWREDAERWRALLGSPYLRIMGHAGFDRDGAPAPARHTSTSASRRGRRRITSRKRSAHRSTMRGSC